MSVRSWAAGAAAVVVAGLAAAVAAPAQAAQPDAPDLWVWASEASGNTGDTVLINLTVSNQGTAAGDPVLAVTAPDATTMVAVDWGLWSGTCVDPSTGEADWTEASELECALEGGLAPETSFEIWVTFRIDGVVGGDGGVVVFDASDPDRVNNDIITITFTGDRVADLAIAATSADGEVGDVVDIVITVTNLGPDSGAPGFYVTVPAGTVAVAADSGFPGVGGCADPSFEGDDPTQWSDATELACSWESELMAGGSLDMTVSFRIDDAEVGDDGQATVVELDDIDPDLSNNTTPIVITAVTDAGGGGELPVTGSRVALFAGVGAGVLVIGGVLYLLTRRRRVVLAAPDEDA